MPLASGTRLGPYEILAPIGAGGMGEVYKARDTRLDRVVALKISKQEFSQRFEREARAIAALNHSHICQLYDVGPNYLVMELVEGQPLKGPLAVDKALVYAAQILDALEAAHKKGIIHRDLKPANILLTRQSIKLLDFGLAKPGTTLKETDATVTSALSGQGQIIGTLQYMSPEQLQGKDADARSDLFAFGCVLYEMLTGKRAFDGSSAASVIAAIMEREAPSVASVAPAALDRIVHRSLAKDPDERWQTARDLRSALELAAEPGPQPAMPARSRSLPWIVAAAFGIVALIAVWAPWRQRSATERAIHFQIGPPLGARFVLGTGGGSAISPDGRMIAVVAVAGGQPKLWIRSLDSLAARELPGTEGAAFPFWSPDSRSLGLFAGGKLKRIDLKGGPPVTLADAGVPRGGSWNQQGIIIFAPSAAGGLRRVSATGGVTAPFLTADSAAGENGHRWPQFLPDGRQFIYFSQNRDASRNAIFLSSLDHPAEKIRLVASGTGACYVPPQGRRPAHLVWFRQGALIAQPFDPKAGKLTGDPLPVADGENASLVSGAYYVGFPPRMTVRSCSAPALNVTS
jgi:predicted Ser/Thr protein kinase